MFEEKKICEFSVLITKGTTPTSVGCGFEDEGINFIKSESIGSGRNLDSTKYAHISEKTHEKLKRSQIKEGDILFSMAGVYLGKTGIVRKEDVPANTNQAVAIIRLDSRKINPEFVYYALNQDSVVTRVNSTSSQSAQPNINLKDIGNISFLCPERCFQDKIAKFLSLIDAKIDVNTQINKNLAEQCQAILNEYMDTKPYVFKPLSDIAVVIDCLHSKKPEFYAEGTKQLLQLDNIKDNGVLDLSYKYLINDSDYENWTRKCVIQEGDCVITNVGRIGAVSQASRNTNVAMGRNMTCIRVTHEFGKTAYFITVLLSEHMKKEIRFNTDEGTIMGSLNVKNIPKLLFPIFDDADMDNLESILKPMRKSIEENCLANQSLAETRDALLPRLMSGEIDVSEIEI